MNYPIKYILAILVFLTGSVLWHDSAFAGKPTKITVTAANPNSALQGTELDVVISGSGFGHGSSVRFLVAGTNDDTQVEVQGTVTFDENTGDLTAFINVLSTATIDFYDIEVRASSGRRGKGTDLFQVNQVGGGGGNQDPTFDVSFGGDMAGSGTDWIQPNASAKNIRYFYHDHPHIGTGEIGLSYFQDESGPFPAGRGKNCFGTDLSTQVVMGMISQTKSGAAGVGILFVGKTEDGQITLDYDITLEGTFADRDDWTPVLDNTVILTSWRLRVAHKNERKKLSNISCVGEGVFETFIDVVRTP